MSTYKKVGIFFFPLIILASLMMAVFPALVSAKDAGAKYWGDCAQLSMDMGGPRCNVLLPSQESKFTYASYHRSKLMGATYQGSNTASSTGKPTNITIVDPDTKLPIGVSGSTEFDPLKWGRFIYSSQQTSEDGVKYLVYTPAGGYNFRLLLKAEPNTNKTYQVLALVNNQIQSETKGPLGDGFVWAWDIKKPTVLTNATGGADTSTPTDGPSTDEESTCESQDKDLGWIFCGVLRGIDTLFTKFDSAIEEQLNFNVKQNLNPSVKQAWTIFRTLASAILVIIMLVMVISQAVSWGPFDAYTVRKVLPRMVIAVIAMQLSWALLGWLIGLANNAGQGIAELLYAPFGGASQLSLDSLLAKLGGAAQGVVVSGGLAAGTLAIIINPFGAILIGFLIIMSVLAALAMLFFRQILIIGSVIFAPIALVAWILPGPTPQKWWKLWSENFFKALILFPLIAGMIAVGRIFAGIISTSGSGSKPLALFGILVGYFGPYFLLPKTFKWGGSLMSMAGNGISQANTRFSQKPKALLEERGKQLKAQRVIGAAERITKWPSMNRRQKFGSRIRGDEFRSGKLDPTLLLNKDMRRERRIKMAKFKGAGPEHLGEEVKAETGALMADLGNYHEKDHDKIREALILGRSLTDDTASGGEDNRIRLANGDRVEFKGKGKTKGQVQAALDRGVVHGHWRAIEHWLDEEMASGDQERMSVATAFKNRNAQAIGTEMPHLLKGLNIASTAKPETIVRMRGEAIESILAKNTANMNNASLDVEKRKEAARNIGVFLRNYGAALSNPNLAGQLDQSGARVVKAYVTNDAPELKKVNETRDKRATPIDKDGYSLQAVPGIATAMAGILASIDPLDRAKTEAEINAALDKITEKVSGEGVIH